MTLQFVSGERMRRMRSRFNERYAEATAKHEHLWVATVCYFITPPLVDGTHLDVENMAMEPALGCFVCETLYEPGVGGHCPGEPS